MKHQKIVIIGAGAVGRTLYCWLAPLFPNLYLLARGQALTSIRASGLSTKKYKSDEAQAISTVNLISSLSEVIAPDMVILTVKNYHLEALCQQIKRDHPQIATEGHILSTQNGLLAQRVLPKYFPRTMHIIIGYNAWPDETGTIFYQNKGPLVLGTLVNELSQEVDELCQYINSAVPTLAVDDIRAAAYTKLVVNLANSLTTLIGHGYRPISNLSLFQKVLTNMTYEAIQMLKKAGISEVKIPHLPSWSMLNAAAILPQFLTRPLFRKNLKKMVMSSMAQDLAKNPAGDNELDTINGEILALARSLKIPMPCNQAIYDLCTKAFGQQNFEPMDIIEIDRTINFMS